MKVFALVCVLALAFAGCISAPGDPGSEAARAEPRDGGPARMTGAESEERAGGLCGGLGVFGGEPYCATRVVTVTGSISGLPLLEITLETFNGNVRISPGKEGAWGLVAKIEARGRDAADAEQKLDAVEFSWEHEERGRHFLHAEASANGGEGVSASLEVSMPRSLLLEVVARTSNGNVAFDGGRTDGLALATSNGGISVEADATNVDLRTSNGGIDAKLRPTGSGRISASTSNGGIKVALAEDATRGYDLEGTTSNGEVEIDLRDGQKGDCPKGSEYYTPPCTHRTFRTSGFDERAIQSRVTLSTSNGSINAEPA